MVALVLGYVVVAILLSVFLLGMAVAWVDLHRGKK